MGEPVITSSVFGINDIVVPEYFKTVRDFKSSCDWFTTGDKSDFFQAIGDAFEWTKVSVDELPRTIEFGANKFEFSQVRDVIKSATKISDLLPRELSKHTVSAGTKAAT